MSSEVVAPRPPLELLSGWLRATQVLLKARWQEHLLPVGIVLGVGMVMGLGLAMLLMVGFTLGAMLESEEIILAVFGLFALALPVIILVSSLVQGAYLNAALRSLETGHLDVADMRLPVGLLVQLGVLQLLVTGTILLGTLFCYVPGLLASVALGFAPGYLLLVRGGIGDALIRSVGAARRHPLDVFALVFAKVMLGAAVSMLPGIGAFLAFALVPVWVTLDAVAVRTMAQAEGLVGPPGQGAQAAGEPA